MSRELRYLNAEHMLAILRQRALELEADLYGQQMERALALKLDLPEVIATTEKKIALFESALEDLDQQVEALTGSDPPGPPPAVPKRRKNRDAE